MDNSLDHFGVALVTAITAMTLFDVKTILGVVVGGFLQFFFSVKKTFKTFFIILISTWFLAFFIIGPLLDHSGLAVDSQLRIVTLSLSGLISVELIVLLIKMLPIATQKRLQKVLNIGTDNV